jgi:hypothetical protein
MLFILTDVTGLQTEKMQKIPDPKKFVFDNLTKSIRLSLSLQKLENRGKNIKFDDNFSLKNSDMMRGKLYEIYVM